MDNGELTAHLVLPRGHVLGQQGHITQSRRAHENCEGEEKWGRSPDPPAQGEVCLGGPTLGFGATLPSRSRTRSPVVVFAGRGWCFGAAGVGSCSALLRAPGRSLALLPWGGELGVSGSFPKVAPFRLLALGLFSRFY